MFRVHANGGNNVSSFAEALRKGEVHRAFFSSMLGLNQFCWEIELIQAVEFKHFCFM